MLGLFQGASWTRYVRSSVLDVIRLDYVTTARSKGLAERAVIMKHVVRNALIPVVTLVALQIPGINRAGEVVHVQQHRLGQGKRRTHAGGGFDKGSTVHKKTSVDSRQ